MVDLICLNYFPHMNHEVIYIFYNIVIKLLYSLYYLVTNVFIFMLHALPSN